MIALPSRRCTFKPHPVEQNPHTVVVVNGVKVTDYTEGGPVPERKFNFEPQRGPRPNDGYVGLQNHSDNDIVFFKEVAVKMLKK